VFVKVEPSGCCERKGLVQARLSFYLDEGDYGYDIHYIQVPVIPEGGYTGEVDVEGMPKDMEDYQKWLDSLPKVWQTNPFHNHFIFVEPETTDEEIKAQMQFHLPNFYAAWRQGWGEVKGGMRHGWDVKTRIRPKRYNKLESPEVYTLRRTRCEARVEDIKNILAQIKTNEKGETFPATAIDVGPGATERTSPGYSNTTVIDLANPANNTGRIDTFELWVRAAGASAVKVGTLQDTGAPNFTPRDYEAVGDVTGGSKQTFSGLDCDVATGDFAGYYSPTDSSILYDVSGGSGNYRKTGDQWGAGEQDYGTLFATRAISIYGTGETAVTEKSSSDTGSGVEALGSRLFGAAETGSGIGVSSLLATLIGTEDSGLGSEFAAKILSALDSGSGTEAHIARLLAATETGSALEAALLIKHLFSSDYGLGGDAIATLLALVIGSEVGSGSEQFRAKIVTFPGAFDMKLLTSAGEVRIPSKGVNL